MANASKISIDGTVYDLRDPTKAPKTVVSKTANGLCPQLPNESTTTKYLRQDGTWAVPPNTTYNVVAKGSNGLCPALPNESTTTKYLRQDGTWVVPPNTTYSVVAKGSNGLCPALPNETTTTKYLRQDGTWVVPPNTTYSVVSKTANGLCPQLPNESTTTKYLRQDGTWVVPPNTTTGTTYNAGSVPANTTFATNGSVKNVYDRLAKNYLGVITTTTWVSISKSFANKALLLILVVSGQAIGYAVYMGISGVTYVNAYGKYSGTEYQGIVQINGDNTVQGLVSANNCAMYLYCI